MDYESFISSKTRVDVPTGLSTVPELRPMLFDFQRDIVQWALRRGRAAIFADCGMGKTFMQLEWASRIPGRVLILAPLAVAEQTVREGDTLGVDVVYARDQSETDAPIVITNYEMLPHFDASQFTGIVLDESSIIKSHDGTIRKMVTDGFSQTPYRLACTATPAPNDYMELATHAEFLGVMTRAEMLSMFFVHDGGDTSKWRLKGHSVSDFWRWLCSWAVMIRRPSDLGYDDGKFTLPPLKIIQHKCDTHATGDFLFAMEAQTLQERQAARRDTIDDRADVAAEIINDTDGPVLIWCNRNAEADAITTRIPGAVNIQGSDSRDVKAQRMMDFSAGKIRVLVTKPKIAGHGMNWQHCNTVIFLGISDSWEQYYQSVRRCWRFGQAKSVTVHIVTADIEGEVVRNIQRKEADAIAMAENMTEHMADITSQELHGGIKTANEHKENIESGAGWEMHLGDCVDVTRTVESDSIGFSVFSPPFASLYTYSASDRDMGNCANDDEFMAHFKYLVSELFRVTQPGRLCSFHCMNIPLLKGKHGHIGVRDFRGELIRMFSEAGWIFHSEVCIWKDPVIQMQRTKAIGLLHKQVVKDSAMSRQGIPDYVVTMRKPGENTDAISGEFTEFVGDQSSFQNSGNYSIDVWQRYASPVWMDINPSRTLQKGSAREEKDERHICPLQLDVIERCLQLWSNPGDLVLSPFAGIGSEGYCALRMGRRFIGIELKESYWRQAVSNVSNAASTVETDLFALTDTP